MMRWTNTTTDRWIAYLAVGAVGDEHHGDVLISKSIHHHLYIKGTTERTLTMDDGSTRVDLHVAPSNKWVYPPSPMNKHFMEVRKFLTDDCAYFCLEQKDIKMNYTFSTDIMYGGQELNTTLYQDLFLGFGKVLLDGKLVDGPMIIENCGTKRVKAVTTVQYLLTKEGTPDE